MKCSVETGGSYRALIEVPWLKRAFANPEVVKGRLVDAGFVNVTVQDAGGGRYWAWGMWLGPDSTEDVDYVTRLDRL